MRWIAALFVTVALVGSASAGVKRPYVQPEHTVWSAYPNATMANGTSVGGYVLPTSRGAIVVALTINVSTASGGGAGNTVFTVTDGTNTCTATFACTDTAGTGSFRATAANGSGTGCTYAPGAALRASVTTAGCTTTQPTMKDVVVIATWR